MIPCPALLVLLIFFVVLSAALSVVLAQHMRNSAVLRRRVEQSARELERLQRAFSRFAPAELVERIAKNGVPESGERRDITVLFADIRGFTRMSEHLDPVLIIEILNGYFSEMSRTISSHHGHVTRVMGDGIMSVFGALEPNPWHVQDAVEAAIEMKRALQRYNRTLTEKGLPELGFGIGIHCGTVITGLIGSEELVEFTVMGDPVNVASRVEALTREFDTDILVTDAVRERVGSHISMSGMPPAHIRGKERPIRTWSVSG